MVIEHNGRPSVEDLATLYNQDPDFHRSQNKKVKVDPDFVQMWNETDSVQEIVEKTGLTTGQVVYRARLCRAAGYHLRARHTGWMKGVKECN